MSLFHSILFIWKQMNTLKNEHVYDDCRDDDNPVSFHKPQENIH
jgi:hypothetical protein